MKLFRNIAAGIVLCVFVVHGTVLADELFRFNGKSYSADQASPRLRTLLYDLELQYFEQRQALADELLFELYMEHEAAKRGVDGATLAEELLALQPVTDQDLRAFYAANSTRIGEPFEQVRERIAQHLRSQRVHAAKADLLAEVKKNQDFELLIAPPEAPPLEIATEGFPRKGSMTPRFTIVEFADYQCPHCSKAARVLDRILDRYPDDVQIVYMDFPVNRSGISRVVAEGAACAHRQGAFWAYHDLAFDEQARLHENSPMELAKALALDEAQFAECLAGRAPKTRVARAESEARRLGLTGTPSIFVNGRPLRSRHLENDLRRLIDSAVRPDQG